MSTRDQPIRILQIISGLDIGRLSGGAEYFGVRLAMGLDSERFQRAVYIQTWHGTETEQEWQQRLRGNGVAVYGTSSTQQIRRKTVAHLQNYRRSLDDFRPEIVTSHSEQADLINLWGKFTHAAHPHSVRTVHIDRQWKTHPWLGAAFEHTCAPLAFDAQIAVSATIQAILERRWTARIFGKRVHVFYNGIDANLLCVPRPEPPPPLAILSRHPIIISVGRLTEQKGFSYLLGALRRIIANHPAHLLLIGAGPLEQTLQAQAKSLAIEANVHFLGWRPDVLSLLPHADIFVSASLWEGLPTVLLEAMACQLPVIATCVSGSKEIVIDRATGLLVAPKDEVALANAINWAIEHPDQMKQFAQTAYASIHRYTFDNTVAQFSSLFSRLVIIDTTDTSASPQKNR
jgi:glycosyltransferase involved in cell wall biosynthesis